MRKNRKLIAFDMDGTLLDGSLISSLAEKFDFVQELHGIQRDSSLLGYQRTEKIASLLKGLSELDIIETVSKMSTVKNWRKTIEELKSHEYILGIISDSYTLACDYLKKKMNLDFVIANKLQTDQNNILTGKVDMPLGWNEIGCNCKISVCKRYHLEMMARRFDVKLSCAIAIGDTNSDMCMIEHAGTGIALNPKDKLLEERADIVIKSRELDRILPFALRNN